jgi:predicted MFS family arabinose efflux permease
MLGGSVAGGFIAQQTNLGVPFVIRGVILLVMFGVAFRFMHDVGFTPQKGARPLAEMRKIVAASVDYGWRVPAVKWLMVQGFLVGGVGVYGFYAIQPYLLELYGDPQAYQIAGLAAAIVAGAQILGGLAASRIRRLFHRRTSALIAIAGTTALTLALVGILQYFWAVIALIVVWGLLFAASMPIRQTYINGMIPSSQRATVLSFDSLMASGGGVWAQPALGRAADVWGYPSSYLFGAGITALALPFLVLSRRQNAPADVKDPANGPANGAADGAAGDAGGSAADAGSSATDDAASGSEAGGPVGP